MVPIQSRRHFLQRLTLGAAFFSTPGLFADVLTESTRLIETPRMTEGPFYPDKMPLDTDNDLLIINDAITPAVGEVTHLSGRIRSLSGEPLRDALVEIWQCDSNGSYVHTHGRNSDGSADRNFQGYGRFLTDSKGQYFFRTIKPVPYTLGGQGRAPHIHFAVSRNDERICTTQMMIRGHDLNARDGILRGIRNPRARETVLVDFKPIKSSKIGESTAHFDIVCGITAQEDEAGKLLG